MTLSPGLAALIGMEQCGRSTRQDLRAEERCAHVKAPADRAAFLQAAQARLAVQS
jgi:hypothetical protein